MCVALDKRFNDGARLKRALLFATLLELTPEGMARGTQSFKSLVEARYDVDL